MEDVPNENILIEWDEIMKYRKHCIEANKNDPTMQSIKKQYNLNFQKLMDTRNIPADDRSRAAFIRTERNLERRCRERQIELRTYIHLGND